MALYRYVKAPPAKPGFLSKVFPALAISPAYSSPTNFRPSDSLSKPSFSLPSQLPLVLMALGTLLILSVAAPIIYHELIVFPRLQKVAMISPVPNTVAQVQQVTQVAGASTFTPKIQDSTTTSTRPASKIDYTQAQNWFPTAPMVQRQPSKITHYTLDIEKLKIKNAVVEIGGNDLKQNLVQYAETANPGEFGSPVIFGHSVLRQFYNPSQSNPNRYMSIFSTIMTLSPGDEILINFDGIKYTYKVVDKYEVLPEQIEVLTQRYDRRTLKLITCTPEGTYLRRGVVEAQLVET